MVIQMADSIKVDRNSEFFIALGKDGKHSFIFLGVMKDDKPMILARFGKSNKIDRNVTWSRAPHYLHSLFTKGSLSKMQGEPIFYEKKRSIHYQAYAITLQQYEELIQRLIEIENSQLTDENILGAIRQSNEDMTAHHLCAYKLTQKTDQSLNFTYSYLVNPGEVSQVKEQNTGDYSSFFTLALIQQPDNYCWIMQSKQLQKPGIPMQVP